MKTFELCDAFRAWCEQLQSPSGAPIFNGWSLLNGQSEQLFATPAAVFDAQADPLAGSGSCFRAVLTIWIESHAQDDSAAAHAGRVELMRQTLFGVTIDQFRSTRDAVKTWINTSTQVKILGYAAEACDPNYEGQRFRTPLKLAVGYSTDNPSGGVPTFRTVRWPVVETAPFDQVNGEFFGQRKFDGAFIYEWVSPGEWVRWPVADAPV